MSTLIESGTCSGYRCRPRGIIVAIIIVNCLRYSQDFVTCNAIPEGIQILVTTSGRWWLWSSKDCRVFVVVSMEWICLGTCRGWTRTQGNIILSVGICVMIVPYVHFDCDPTAGAKDVPKKPDGKSCPVSCLVPCPEIGQRNAVAVI